jgi:N-acetylmuramoyl-L-alanine amidase CwlA
MAEAQYFVNGAEGRQASVHACSDDRGVVIVVPLDEVTWQAADGAGPGNMNGLSCEMMEASAIWNDASRRDRLIAITADFMGRCSARLSIVKPERHWDFNAGSANRHHCPNMLMTTGLWESSYVPKWHAARADELKRMGSGGKPVYATPDPPALKAGKPFAHYDEQGALWLVLSPQKWTALKSTARRQYAEPDAPEVGSPVDAGDRISAIYSVTQTDGSVWFVSRAGSRMRAEAFVPVVP